MPRNPKTAKGIELGKIIGNNIKKARNRLGMTQSDVAEALGVENVTISRIETGAQLPSVDRLNAIATILKTPLPLLVSDANENDAFGGLLTEVVKDLPQREKEFLFAFAVQYAQHWRAGRRK